MSQTGQRDGGEASQPNSAEYVHTLELHDGSSRVTIPLNISVSIGTPILHGATPTNTGRTEGNLFRGPATVPENAVFSLPALTSSQFTWEAALSTALASKLAYEDSDSVVDIAEQWGFETAGFFDIRRTQCFVCANENVILVSFRGTKELNDWLTNLDIKSMRVDEIGRLHRGFLSAFSDARAAIESAIGMQDDRKFVLTGHSLGGALATIAAASWANKFAITSVYTFGQPAVGKGDFSDFMTERYAERFFRIVNDDDIVAKVPPTYRHVGRLFHLDKHGGLRSNLEATANSSSDAETMTEQEFEQLKKQLQSGNSLETAHTEGFFPSVSDHSMTKYITKICGLLT